MLHTESTNSSMSRFDSLAAQLGHPHLETSVIADVLTDRLEEMGASESCDQILEKAMAGDEGTLRLLRTLPLPAPVSRLVMPVQSLDSGPMRHAFSLAFGRLAAGRG